MKSLKSTISCATALAVAVILAAGPVMADKPSRDDAGKGRKNERMDRRDEQRSERRGDDSKAQRDGPSTAKRGHFGDRHSAVVREYYDQQIRSGRCPPGLAKKHNGCMPPGQAKKWQFGRPLPRDVIYYDVPHELVVQIGVPPSGYRYVRVATDILMIAVGTGLVIDAIQDLGR